MKNSTDPENTWELQRGDEVVALKDLAVCPVLRGMVGVVFEEADAYGDGGGPMVRWENGAACNVYPGDARCLPRGLRPATLALAKALLDNHELQNLPESTCECCEEKRRVLKNLQESAPWVLEVVE